MKPDNIDQDRLIEAALAILSLTSHDQGRVWKALDFDLMNVMFEKGWISDPKNKVKSVYLTEEGRRLAPAYMKKHFSKDSKPQNKKTNTPIPQDLQHIEGAHVICCTAKLFKEIRIEPLQSIPDQVKGFHVWYANLLLIERRKCVLFTNAQTLYSFVVLGIKKPDFGNLNQVFLQHLIANFKAEDIGELYTAKLKIQPPNVLFAKTQNRSVLGSMNDLAFQTEVVIDHRGGISDCDPIWLSQQLNRVPLSALDYVFAIDSIKQVFMEYQSS